jgi:hypothetical protein
MISNASVTRIALRYLRALDTFGLPDEDLEGLADFLAGQVGGMDDESVCVATYVCNAIPGNRQNAIKTLYPKLLLTYRKRLVGWFQ